MNYEEAYTRYIGIFTEQEQRMLRDSKIVVSGLGGVGGGTAAAIARYGAGEMIVIDLNCYDEPE